MTPKTKFSAVLTTTMCLFTDIRWRFDSIECFINDFLREDSNSEAARTKLYKRFQDTENSNSEVDNLVTTPLMRLPEDDPPYLDISLP
jgi:hypothetical protein